MTTQGEKSDRYIIAWCIFALLALGTFERASVWNSPVALWQDASRLAPKHSRPRMNVAKFMLDAHDYAGARREYERILRDAQIDRTPLYQSNARNGALTNLGLLDAVEGNYQRSEQYLNLVIAEWPNLPYARINRGMARLAMNRCEDARQDFKTAGVQQPQCG
jgi:tetratricopeptide (TPR) repeat protein